MSKCGRTTVLAIVGLLTVASSASARTGERFSNDEFGFSGILPSGRVKCFGTTNTHIHGVGTVLVGRDCENRTRNPTLGIWADYNTLSSISAVEVLAGDPRCGGKPPRVASGIWADAIDGLETAVCESEGPEGQRVLVLAAQSGASDDGEKKPEINYVVYLETNKGRHSEDLSVFRNFLATLKIRK